MTPAAASVILATYNERDNLKWLIPQVEAVFRGRPLEIVVVDDGSPDGTAEAAEAFNAEFGNIRVIRRPGRAGLGSALRCGYDAARHDVLVSCDADGSFAPAVLVQLADAVECGAGLALGSRHAPGGGYEAAHWSIWIKRQVSRGGNWFLRCATALPYRDFSSNCRAMRRTTWQAIRTRENSNALLLEVILNVAALGESIAEIPVIFAERRAGRSKLNLWIEIPKYLWVMRRHLIRYRRTAGRRLAQPDGSSARGV